jgi:hypothetical protein
MDDNVIQFPNRGPATPPKAESEVSLPIDIKDEMVGKLAKAPYKIHSYGVLCTGIPIVIGLPEVWNKEDHPRIMQFNTLEEAKDYSHVLLKILMTATSLSWISPMKLEDSNTIDGGDGQSAFIKAWQQYFPSP